MNNHLFALKTLSVFCALAMAGNTYAQATSAKVEEVIVTGQKIDRSLQDTAASVAVITEQAMSDLQVENFYDVIDMVPNVHGTLGTGFSIRGIDAFNVSGGGNSYLASVYVDGAPLPYRAIQKGGFYTWDVTQVEILRGPQSTLQGRNALAGAVIVNTKNPTYEWDGKVRVAAAEYGKQQLAFAGGGALVDDVLAFRISAEKNDFDGFNNNITRGDHSDFNNNNTYRAKLLFEPMEDFSALLSFTRTETEVGVRWVQPDEEGNNHKRITYFNDPTFETNDADITTLKLDYSLSEAMQLVSITSYSDSQYAYEWDGDASAEPLSVLVDDRTDKTFSQEFRLTFNYDRLSGVVGAYYSDLDVVDTSSGQRGLPLQQTGLDTLLLAPPEYGGLGLDPATANMVLGLYAPIDPVQLGTYSQYTQAVETQAIFTDLTFKLTAQWDIFGGLRWDKEKQANSSNSQYTIDNAQLLPNPLDYAIAEPQLSYLLAGINAQLYQLVENASGTAPLVNESFDEWLPKIGTTYHFSDDVNLSFTFQQGYRSGGVGTNVGRGEIFSYDAEYTDNYELALRTSWLDGALTANANAFWIDWQDQQIAVQLSGNSYDTETRNAGKSIVKGFELELNYAVTDAVQIYGGVGYSKTEFDEFLIVQPARTYDLAGRPFASAPDLTLGAGITYRASGLFANLNANYASSSILEVNPYANGLSEGDSGFDPKNEARTLVNLKVGYEWSKVALYATVNNLLDEEYIEQASRGTPPSVTLGAPRQFGMSIDYRF